ncbi:hypothetical protein QCA50_019574 [Cerrena zonata]|uniref:Maturase K n=1 Tax=Cerrena zonata TaxID=2478898 RepID=A0AAW0FJB9_9APHY
MFRVNFYRIYHTEGNKVFASYLSESLNLLSLNDNLNERQVLESYRWDSNSQWLLGILNYYFTRSWVSVSPSTNFSGLRRERCFHPESPLRQCCHDSPSMHVQVWSSLSIRGKGRTTTSHLIHPFQDLFVKYPFFVSTNDLPLTIIDLPF